MTLKQLIETSATYLGWQGDISLNADYDILKRCANLVINELACEYAPVTTTDVLYPSNGRVKLSSLKHECIEILSVKGYSDVEVDYTVNSEEIIISSFVANVTYTYVPGTLNLEDNVPLGDRRINEKTLAYGVVAEYCLISGRYEEAVIYNNKFTSSLKSAMFRPSARIKERKFI